MNDETKPLSGKVKRARKQRDYWKSQHDKIYTIMEMFPYIVRKHDEYQSERERSNRIREQDIIIKSQMRTIDRLEWKLKRMENKGDT